MKIIYNLQKRKVCNSRKLFALESMLKHCPYYCTVSIALLSSAFKTDIFALVTF